MFLIDTSVWIDSLRKIDNEPARLFRRILDEELPFGITGVIYQEVLQGASSRRDFDRLESYLATQRFFDPQDPILSHAGAARIYRRCREAGVTIRSTIDCLIAQVALEHDLHLVHNDRDFRLMADVVEELKTS